MNLDPVDITILVVYAIGIFVLAQWVSREKGTHEKNAQDYFLASRALPWWAIGTSLIAANISAEQIIGMSGSGMLDKVAGPVGEALIMTGIGLAVALPAVMGYNWLTRSNRVLTAKLDAFAFELLTFLSMGRALQGRSLKAGGMPLAAVK